MTTRDDLLSAMHRIAWLETEAERLREDRDRILDQSDEQWLKLDAAQTENKRLREAGNALADAVSDIMGDDPESVLHTWVLRWREVDITAPPSTRTDYERQLEWQRQAEDAGSTDV